MILKRQKGFTLMEVMVSMVIAILILLLISSTFILHQIVFRKSDNQAELTQNARITTDFMSREIRQAKKIVTSLPPNNNNPQLLVDEILFEDGHVSDQIQYIRYYLNNRELRRQIIVYYFDTNPTLYVRHDDVNPFGPPTQEVIEEKSIGEHFDELYFFGQTTIGINITLSKNNQVIKMDSVINPRNI